MTKVYISSTTKDLLEYRTAVAQALRKIRCDVVSMEESVARHRRTRAACEADVGECDIYVGIFAWRYGTIPDDDNEARTSSSPPARRSIKQTNRARNRTEQFYAARHHSLWC
jgi:hypothetical protein